MVSQSIVEQFDHRKPERDLTASAGILKAAGAKAHSVIGENLQADDVDAVAIAQPILVDVHPLAEAALGLALAFDMDQHPGLGAVARAYADQFVGIAASAWTLDADLLKLFVETDQRNAPVDLGMDGGKEQREEFREEALEGLVPGIS